MLSRILRFRRNRQEPLLWLLSATIATDENYNYEVSFKEHHPDLAPTEYIRLPLHYYAKVMFNWDLADPEMAAASVDLMRCMGQVVHEPFISRADLLERAGIDDTARLGTVRSLATPIEILTHLYYVSAMRRHIATEIPPHAYAQHVHFSVVILVQAIVSRLAPQLVPVLHHALRGMNARYESGAAFWELEELAAIPAQAYAAAAQAVG